MKEREAIFDRVVSFDDLEKARVEAKTLSGNFNQYDRAWFIGEPPNIITARPYVYEGLIQGKWVNPDTKVCEYRVQTKGGIMFTVRGDKRLYRTKEEALDVMNH